MYFKGFHKILHVLVLIFSYVGLETCKKYPNLGILTLYFFFIQNKRLPCEQHDTTAASQQGRTPAPVLLQLSSTQK